MSRTSLIAVLLSHAAALPVRRFGWDRSFSSPHAPVQLCGVSKTHTVKCPHPVRTPGCVSLHLPATPPVVRHDSATPITTLHSENMSSGTLCILLVGIGVAAKVIWELYLSPIARQRIPGPKLAAVSDIWHTWVQIRGYRTFTFHELFEVSAL